MQQTRLDPQTVDELTTRKIIPGSQIPFGPYTVRPAIYHGRDGLLFHGSTVTPIEREVQCDV